MKITRWGDSLAVKIPDDVVEALHLKEGDTVDLQRPGSTDVGITRLPETDPERRAEALETLRALARPLPGDYKFDREEANAR